MIIDGHAHLGGEYKNLAEILKTLDLVQKQDALTTSGRFKCSFHKYFNNKHLYPFKDDQLTSA